MYELKLSRNCTVRPIFKRSNGWGNEKVKCANPQCRNRISNQNLTGLCRRCNAKRTGQLNMGKRKMQTRRSEGTELVKQVLIQHPDGITRQKLAEQLKPQLSYASVNTVLCNLQNMQLIHCEKIEEKRVIVRRVKKYYYKPFHQYLKNSKKIMEN